MTHRISVSVSTLLCALCLLVSANEAKAQSNFRIGPSGKQVAAAFIGAGAAIGVGVYFIARAPRSTGCVLTASTGYALQGTTAGDPLFLLEGDTSKLKVGEQVKVVGRKHKDKSGNRFIHVTRMAKDYGTCSKTATSSLPLTYAGRTS